MTKRELQRCVRQVDEIITRLREEKESIRNWLKSKGLSDMEARDVACQHKLGGIMFVHAAAAGF
jgi:hypothetical protein